MCRMAIVSSARPQSSNRSSTSRMEGTGAWVQRFARLATAASLAGFGLAIFAGVACDDGTEDGNPPPACKDDGLFCNGTERMVGSTCAKVPANPCDDGVACTTDTCDEATKTCSHTETGADCAQCFVPDCTPDCTGKACGGDGCGNSCGDCTTGNACSALGQCAPTNGLGTCANPRELMVQLGGQNAQTITGDTTNGVNQVVPTCNSTSTAVEDVYHFVLGAKTGIEATTHDFDTVLHIRKAACLDDSPAATVACSDDSAPPGDYGSRINAMLDPGEYYLIVDGFDDTQFGPYTLKVKFIDGCVPNCDGQFCNGDDGCSGSCGTCDPGMKCGADLRCYPDPCTPNCTNEDGSPRTCGDDACGGTCGDCKSGELCVPKTGACATFAECDHDAPTCAPACGAGDYCGSDCACHGATDPLPDLVINGDRLANEMLFDTVHVGPTSCSSVEQCVGGLGDRKVLRFSVEAINQGQATLTVPPPDEHPDLFHFSQCHGHFHFNGFAKYELLDDKGNVVVQGRKEAYCMEDTTQVLTGPNISCEKQYDCSNQGIQPGWSDLYGNALDCQWLDITETPPGKYKLRVTLNPNHAFEEVTLDNNAATVDVTIP
jgi:hypothetical protein